MKVADLLLRIQHLPPNAEILAFDPDAGYLLPVTGYVFENGARPTVELCTDDMNGEPGPWTEEQRAQHLGSILDQIELQLLGAPEEVSTAEIHAIQRKLQSLAWPGRCPAAPMKPDACSDRSQCFEACGPHGQPGEISPAVATLHAPNGIVHACAQHASTARLQASFLGTHAYVDEAPAGTPCTYCATRCARHA